MPGDDLSLEPEEWDEEESFFLEVERVKNKISSFEKKILFALDNIEHLEEDEENESPELRSFMTFIGEIASKNVKILFSSSKYEARFMPED